MNRNNIVAIGAVGVPKTKIFNGKKFGLTAGTRYGRPTRNGALEVAKMNAKYGYKYYRIVKYGKDYYAYVSK